MRQLERLAVISPVCLVPWYGDAYFAVYDDPCGSGRYIRALRMPKAAHDLFFEEMSRGGVISPDDLRALGAHWTDTIDKWDQIMGDDGPHCSRNQAAERFALWHGLPLDAVDDAIRRFFCEPENFALIDEMYASKVIKTV